MLREPVYLTIGRRPFIYFYHSDNFDRMSTIPLANVLVPELDICFAPELQFEIAALNAGIGHFHPIAL
jgi:hypothetical protein